MNADLKKCYYYLEMELEPKSKRLDTVIPPEGIALSTPRDRERFIKRVGRITLRSFAIAAMLLLLWGPLPPDPITGGDSVSVDEKKEEASQLESSSQRTISLCDPTDLIPLM